MPYYVCALPNKKGTAAPAEFISDDPAKIEEWAQRHDRDGWGVYDCHNPLKPGATRRAKDTVAAMVRIVIDVDPKDVVETMEEVDARLDGLVLRPSEVRDSGRGRHVEFVLKEPVDPDDAEMVARVDAVRERLAEVLCGDRQVLHHAAVFRRPGTHNTKDGARLLCRALAASDVEYDLTELEEMVALYDRPVLTAKPAANGGDNVAYIDFTGGIKAPIDVEARLAEMRYQGPGETGINATWWVCMGSLLRSGMSVVDTIDKLHAAAAANCQDDPNKENWYRDLVGMAERWLNHEPEFVHRLDPALYKVWQVSLKLDKRPRMYWRTGLGLQVRGHAQAVAQPLGAAVTVSDTGAAVVTLPRQAPAEAPGWPTPYSGRSVSLIPIRNFILGQHYLQGAASITAAAGGVGKSTLHLLEAVSFIVGRNLLTGEVLEGRRRVWAWNAEDDVDEMERRVVAICGHYNIERKDLDGWLFLDSGYELPLDLAHGTGKGAVLQDGLIDLIAQRVKERAIDVVQLDPLVALHSMSEGDNPGHAKLIRTLATKVAKPCNCAVEINAHTRKPGVGQDGMTVDDIRGAGAIIYSARSGRILHPMTLAEAEKYQIDPEERVSYYRLERAKANMARRGTVCWVHMIEVPIANRPDGAYGDVVAVPTLWVPPDAMEGVSDAVAAGIASEMAKSDYRRDVRSGTSWAGRLVGIRCGLDVGSKSGRDRAKAILETLIKRGALAVEIRTDKNRNAREFVVPGAPNAPHR